MEDQNVIIHMPLLSVTLVQPNGKKFKELIVCLVLLSELQILETVTVHEVVNLIGTEDAFLPCIETVEHFAEFLLVCG
jgi:hypothetical protein